MEISLALPPPHQQLSFKLMDTREPAIASAPDTKARAPQHVGSSTQHVAMRDYADPASLLTAPKLAAPLLSIAQTLKPYGVIMLPFRDDQALDNRV